MHAQRDRISVQWLLIFFLAGSSASPSRFFQVSYHVGHKAVLPCNWTSFMEGSPSPLSAYLTWQTPEESVFEMLGAARFEGKGYEGRVEVLQQGFEHGDCSLCLRELRFSDAGLYESFVAVGDGRTRSFIRSVQLAVRDHKYRESLREGGDLVLKLHTPEAMTVVFQGSGQPEWGVVWERGAQEGSRGVLNGDKELIITGVQMKDAGTYKVMDSQGLAISTVHLRVTEIPKIHKPIRREHYETQGGKDAHSGVCSVGATALLILASLLFSSL
ncbi:galectin 17 [Megalops cyprinoides]|uniref:galectin 17 n=1 Tax=Megalops cyprinoides TaxID=118141 RepID=UPI00186476C9|nr:galectin 17 [Megalops cyprinoides]